ncbi:MAG: EamA family transporter [bacterium]|nr:EamA family transporter [bacterium]
MKTLALVLFSILMGVAGQLCLKAGVSGGGINMFSLEFFKLFLRPLVIGGFLAYGISSLSWLMVLSRTELSYAYPMVALAYVFVFILSWILFKEHITWPRIVGMALICAGVVMVAITKPPTTT